MGDNRNRWTPRQDRIIMKCKSPRAAHRAIGQKHTLGSIIQRRYQLHHLETVVARWHPGERLWTKDEKGVLHERWRTSTTAKDLAPYLPRFTLCQIRSKAHKMGLKRKFLGEADVPIAGHRELVDQIRVRAKEDGISFKALDD